MENQESESTRNRKVLLIGPGAIYSTFDVYANYLDSFSVQPNTDVAGFAYHFVLEYHAAAREAMKERYGIDPPDGVMLDITRASREVLMEIYLHQPDYVLFVDGSKFPPNLYTLLRRFRKDTGLKFVLACYITEAPYINDVTDNYAKQFDVLFTNDKLDVERRRKVTGRNNVVYLPHSYDIFRHYPPTTITEKPIDVFFCGTLYPERAATIAQVDWSGINVVMYGTGSLLDDDVLSDLEERGIFTDKILDNDLVADYYRKSKICLSFNRAYGWDNTLEQADVSDDDVYSVGPRVIEAAACGAFVLSEHRPELVDIFDNSVPIFKSAKELEGLVRYYLANETERNELAAQSLKAVTGMTYDHRAAFVLSVLDTAWNQIFTGGSNV